MEGRVLHSWLFLSLSLIRLGILTQEPPTTSHRILQICSISQYTMVIAESGWPMEMQHISITLDTHQILLEGRLKPCIPLTAFNYNPLPFILTLMSFAPLATPLAPSHDTANSPFVYETIESVMQETIEPEPEFGAHRQSPAASYVSGAQHLTDAPYTDTEHIPDPNTEAMTNLHPLRTRSKAGIIKPKVLLAAEAQSDYNTEPKSVRSAFPLLERCNGSRIQSCDKNKHMEFGASSPRQKLNWLQMGL